MATATVTARMNRYECWLCWGTPDQVGAVRRRLRRRLGAAHPCLDRVALCASEICTNAISHTASGSADPARRWFVVEVAWADAWVKTSVHDTGAPGLPRLVNAAEEDENGRGLLIVKSEADEWGEGPSPNGLGRVVWFVVHAA
jgi:anti-sigma regulatory factor (Ser/Thr protein kinase)